jgi:DNA-binding XRE family transcriptional regulator
MSTSSYCIIESGDDNSSVYTVIKISKVLKASIEFIFNFDVSIFFNEIKWNILVLYELFFWIVECNYSWKPLFNYKKIIEIWFLKKEILYFELCNY